jgi:hypothetical protein
MAVVVVFGCAAAERSRPAPASMPRGLNRSNCILLSVRVLSSTLESTKVLSYLYESTCTKVLSYESTKVLSYFRTFAYCVDLRVYFLTISHTKISHTIF